MLQIIGNCSHGSRVPVWIPLMTFSMFTFTLCPGSCHYILLKQSLNGSFCDFYVMFVMKMSTNECEGNWDNFHVNVCVFFSIYLSDVYVLFVGEKLLYVL